eukprot:TRINITY_DN38601_c0_g1_i1.p1 TRINITY_DN38601_c0_g1~~TRINITY_DN38601_c0_g1_i1.p1  ORF type:complete len:167 (+),score=16.68 TRINITY_DN38601_c0_g1_i1:45-545(+)
MVASWPFPPSLDILSSQLRLRRLTQVVSFILVASCAVGDAARDDDVIVGPKLKLCSNGIYASYTEDVDQCDGLPDDKCFHARVKDIDALQSPVGIADAVKIDGHHYVPYFICGIDALKNNGCEAMKNMKCYMEVDGSSPPPEPGQARAGAAASAPPAASAPNPKPK